MEFLSLTADLLTRIKLTLISSFAAVFKKSIFRDLVILNFVFPYALLHASCQLFEKQAVLCENNSVLLRIRDSLLSVTNRCIKVTSKLILPSVSKFKFALLKSRVKLIWSKSNVSHYRYVNRTILCNLLTISIPLKEEIEQVNRGQLILYVFSRKWEPILNERYMFWIYLSLMPYCKVIMWR